MKERLLAGLDLGSAWIRLAVGQVSASPDRRETLQIIGGVQVPSHGLSKGAVSSLEDLVSSISACLEQGERQIGVPISEAYVGLGGMHIQVQSAKGVIGVSRPDGDIREEDVQRVLESARSIVNPANLEILHVLPQSFTVDNQTGIKDPVGMQGIRLEVETHIVMGLTGHVRNLTKAVVRTGLDVTELVFGPLATAEAVSTSRQRELGVVIINLGAATTSMSVFENGELLHAAVIPIGSDHITSDIAIGLRTSLEVAERCKTQLVSAWASEVSKDELVDLRDMGAPESELVGPRFMSDVAHARVEELFERVEAELRKIDRSGLLPAGALLTGGGAKLRGIIEVAKQTLRLPAAIAQTLPLPTPMPEVIQDPAFSTAVGLVTWGFEGERASTARPSSMGGMLGGGGEWLKKLTNPMKKVFKSFIP